jgi:hypothetical protein
MQSKIDFPRSALFKDVVLLKETPHVNDGQILLNCVSGWRANKPL